MGAVFIFVMGIFLVASEEMVIKIEVEKPNKDHIVDHNTKSIDYFDHIFY